MPVIRRGLLILAAILAMALAIVRARSQSITLDEADTYFWFASRSASYIWYPFPNNHVLNTLLIWCTTHLLGTSNLTVRVPALLGAGVYIATCYFLCRSITNEFMLQFPLFICLIYNPYVLDFMSAARGYSLADAFLLAAIAVPVWHRLSGRPSLLACCAMASLALGLSFGANFSFAFVDISAFLVLVAWAMRRRDEVSILRIASFCVLPGLSVALLLGGYPMSHWPKGELWYGAHSLTEMRRSLLQASLYQLNKQLLDVNIYDTLDLLRPVIIPLLAALCCCQLIVTRIDGSWFQDARARWLGRLAIALAGVVTLSLAMSWAAFRFAKLPLPMGRTGIYFIPLCTLVVGIIAAAPANSVLSTWLRRGIAGVLVGLSCYFLGCLRWTYFEEYQFDADVKDVYSVLASLNHTYGVSDVAVEGMYVSSLNFYRFLSKKETFPEFQYVAMNQVPTDKSIYVLNEPYEHELIQKLGLSIIYKGPSTDVVIAVPPRGSINLTKRVGCCDSKVNPGL